MNRRIHYLEGWPSTAGIEPDPEILCGDPDPYDYNTDRDFVTCPDCLLRLYHDPLDPEISLILAGIHRRAELDAWLRDLQARGLARVIPVRDLDVELEASHAGRLALSYTEPDGTPARYLFVSAADAAAALGVSS